ncbi:MAG TPA: DUF6152 family protein [Candidatus Acidoferrales bacterium]|jgi:hypothetical protein|nr:DUF6152 family protein [Verrucomicrobiae bacterium]HZP33747.1 DUF6152 family protein [Candidatus Acidoferrales bacterium]
MKTKFARLTVVAALLGASLPLLAHHGTGVSYDMKKVTTLKGVVTRFAFANPHSQLYFDVTDEKGNITHWAAEMRAPGNLIAEGYTRHGLMEKLAPGTPITVTGNPSKSGAPVLVFSKAVLGDGYCICNQDGGIGKDQAADNGGAQ